MINPEGGNPYAAPAKSEDTRTLSSQRRWLRHGLPFLLFPASFLGAAIVITQIDKHRIPPIEYIKLLVIDAPVPFLGVSTVYLLLRRFVFLRSLSEWPLLSAMGGFAAFFLMTPVYFLLIDPLFQQVDSDLLASLLLFLAGALSAILVEWATKLAISSLWKAWLWLKPE